MMSHEIETTPLGTILSDGHCGPGDGEMFKGIGARYLRESSTEQTSSHTEYRDFSSGKRRRGLDARARPVER